MAACSYVNGQGDAKKFAERFIADNFHDAAATSYQCQSRDTDENGYVTCSVTVQWSADDPAREMIPLECAVNRTGSGCSNEGCRPMVAFGRPGRGSPRSR
jgi:hypothetical protein